MCSAGDGLSVHKRRSGIMPRHWRSLVSCDAEKSLLWCMRGSEQFFCAFQAELVEISWFNPRRGANQTQLGYYYSCHTAGTDRTHGATQTPLKTASLRDVKHASSLLASCNNRAHSAQLRQQEMLTWLHHQCFELSG